MSIKRKEISSLKCDTKKWKRWTMSLLDTMKDPDSIVKKSVNAVIIKDKYPKATLHYLILPYEDISSIEKLTPAHLPLLYEFKTLFEEVIIENPNLQLRAGFHALPSMYRLHMHIISTDMISPCLKTKVHWNSFTTVNFIPLDDDTVARLNDGVCLYHSILNPEALKYGIHDCAICALARCAIFIKFTKCINKLKLNNHIKEITKEEHKTLMATPLQCNQCPYLPKTMPDLKQHLVTHSS